MSEIKLVLSDIDGTIVWHGQHDPTPAVREAIDDVQNAGIELTAATGRPYEMAQELFADLGFRDLGIFDAGASIRDVATGEFAWKNWLEPSRLREVAGIILPRCTIIDFFPTYKEVSPDEADIDDITKPAPYVFAFVEAEAVQKVNSQLQAIPDICVHIGPGRRDMPGFIDFQVTDINSDKFHAVNALRHIVHSTKEQTLAIGDSTNDVPLFRNAGTKIAMGNAMDVLKEQADYVVGSVDEDGFAEAMQRFVLK